MKPGVTVAGYLSSVFQSGGRGVHALPTKVPGTIPILRSEMHGEMLRSLDTYGEVLRSGV